MGVLASCQLHTSVVHVLQQQQLLDLNVCLKPTT
jgi:hypothetical protein